MVEVDQSWIDSVNYQISSLNQTTNSQANKIFVLESSLDQANEDIKTLYNYHAEQERKIELLKNAHDALASKTTQHISTGERGTV